MTHKAIIIINAVYISGRGIH